MKYYPVHAGYPPYAEVNPAIEAAFAEHGRGNVQMPPKVYVTLVENGDFRTMPAYLPARGIAGVKIVNVHPHNRTRGLPTVMALTIIIDIKTGIPTAIINATELTALRTGGAAGAIAAKYLAPPRHPVTLGIVGTGRQAEAQVEATAASLAIEEILVWSRTEKSAEAFATRYSEYNARSVPIERACDCDVLTTTTPSTKPVVMADWIHEGTHINAIGADAPPASRNWIPRFCSKPRSSSTTPPARRPTRARSTSRSAPGTTTSPGSREPRRGRHREERTVVPPGRRHDLRLHRACHPGPRHRRPRPAGRGGVRTAVPVRSAAGTPHPRRPRLPDYPYLTRAKIRGWDCPAIFCSRTDTDFKGGARCAPPVLKLRAYLDVVSPEHSVFSSDVP